ncbi:MAG TPA: hypothetical protein GX507_00165 [Clostridia bacterium]|nr:hypothetical protein [Clostridia bacterium]
MTGKAVACGAITVLVIGIFLAPFASPNPDGLERVAEDLGFIGAGFNAITAPIPDYVFPSPFGEKVSVSLAGAFGVGLVFMAVTGLLRFIAPKRS